MYLRYIHFCYGKSMRSLHVGRDDVLGYISSISSLTLKVNKLQNRFIKLIENKKYYKKIFLFILKNKIILFICFIN